MNFGVSHMFVTLIMGMVLVVYTHVKTHQIVYFKHVQFITHPLSLEVVKQKNKNQFPTKSSDSPPPNLITGSWHSGIHSLTIHRSTYYDPHASLDAMDKPQPTMSSELCGEIGKGVVGV